MQAKLQLSITEPCHENWQNMNPTEQGRYCNACAKEVVDFTGMSDAEVLYYFINRKKENVCGRLYADQMNRDTAKPVYAAVKKFWYWNYFVMVFLLLFKGNTGKGQKIQPVQAWEQLRNTAAERLTGVVGGITMTTDKIPAISGKIIDQDGVPVPSASIQVKGTNRVTLTDANGEYHLTAVKTKDKLLIYAVGFRQMETKVSHTGKNECVLKRQEGAVEGLIVVAGSISISDDDRYPPTSPTHVAVIEVKDDATSMPVKARIRIKKGAADNIVDLNTDKKGIYKLKRIKEADSYFVTISAAGYKDTVLNIKGQSFTKLKETRYVFLAKENEEKRRMVVGGVSSRSITDAGPLYIVDGVLAETINNLQPREIVNMYFLRGTASAIYGERANQGVVIITTKKKTAAGSPSSKTGSCSVLTQHTEQSTRLGAETLDPITDFKIAPSPVQKGNSCKLSFTAKLSGNYLLQILNETGSMLQSQKISVTANNNMFQLQTNINWASGTYYIRVQDARGNILHTGRFIIQ
jgi:hypothetical protein